MRLGRIIRDRIDQGGPFQDQLQELVATQDNVTLRCELSGADRLSCALTQVKVVDEGATILSAEALTRRAEGICSTITYLLEPLRPIEIDRLAGAAMLRSHQPRRQENCISYYELLVGSDHLTAMRRYCYEVSSRQRQAVRFVLTKDQLELLLDDLAATTYVPIFPPGRKRHFET